MVLFHCALSIYSPDTPECTFQCDTKLELDKHIRLNHNKKTQLPCSVCKIYLTDLDDLAKHMTEKHKNGFPCRNCEIVYDKKEELDKHIFEEHISYKPCRNFATNNCEYGEKCRYKHIVLKPGEHLCYKCGDMFERKSILLNHIKNFHNDPCLKYLEGNCTYGRRCIYSHTEIIVQDVVRTPSNANSYEDFPQLPPTEKRLGGSNKSSTEHLMYNMNQLVNQMSQIMTLMKHMLAQ